MTHVVHPPKRSFGGDHRNAIIAAMVGALAILAFAAGPSIIGERESIAAAPEASINADAARWNALAGYYTEQAARQRAIEAWSDRLSAQSVLMASADPSRARMADAARWNGLAAHGSSQWSRAQAADAARWNGLAAHGSSQWSRAQAADAARWNGLAAYRSGEWSRAQVADAARWNGLADELNRR